MPFTRNLANITQYATRITHVRWMLIIFVYCLSNASIYSQIHPLPLDQIVRSSDYQFIGRPIHSQAIKDPMDGMIYTIWDIAIHAWFSGDSSTLEQVSLITPGGTLAHEEVRLCPMDDWEAGRTYMFLCVPAPTHLADLVQLPEGLLQPVAPVQAALPKERAGYPVLFDKGYLSEADLIATLESITGFQPRTPSGHLYHADPDDALEADLRMANITNIIEISGSQGPFYGGLADPNEEILILGSDFGTSGTIYFKNADNGGMSTVTTLSSNSEEVMMWKTDSIRVKVHRKATSGDIRVNSSNNVNRAIDWAVNPTSSGGNRVQVELIDKNGSGGYTISYHDNIINTSGAKDALNQAVETWRCGSMVNWEVDDNGVSNGWNLNDGVNTILFDNNIPQGVLGQAQYSYVCNVQGNCRVCYLNAFDIRFPTSVSVELFPGFNIEYAWRFINDPGGQWYDFPSVALHELGHVHGLNHGLAADVMYYTLLNNTEKDTLTVHAEDAALYIMDESVDVNCLSPPNPMIALAPADCELNAQPLAVELLSFRGIREEMGHQLVWTTASEQGTDLFLLEWQAGEAGDFQTIHTTPSRGGMATGASYQYLHTQPGPGTHYYRLSEVEHSGQIHILGVVAIEEPGERLSLHPQPATDHLFLTGWSYPPQEVKVRILDAWGRIVSSTDHMMAPQDPAMLDVSGLPSGIYRMILSSSTILDSISFVIH